MHEHYKKTKISLDETAITRDDGHSVGHPLGLPAILALATYSGASPDVKSSIHWTIFKRTPHLNEQFHWFIA